MEEEGKLKPVKKSKFEEIVGKEGLLMEPGLFVELAKWFKGEKNRVDLVLMLEMYKRLFPEVSLPQKKKKKVSGLRTSLEEELAREKITIVAGMISHLIEAAILSKPAFTLEELLQKIQLANEQGAGEEEIAELLGELQKLQGNAESDNEDEGIIEGEHAQKKRRHTRLTLVESSSLHEIKSEEGRPFQASALDARGKQITGEEP